MRDTAAAKAGSDLADNTLVKKGHHLHELLLYLMLFFSLLYTVVNFFFGTRFEMLVTMIPLLTTLVCFYLVRRKLYCLSKGLNLIQATLVVGALGLYTSPATGILAFFVPIFIGILITFQGKEIRIGYALLLYAFSLLVGILVYQYYTTRFFSLTHENLRMEWILNYIGAALATVFEIVFILKLSESIQIRLVEKSDILKMKNEELQRINYKFDLITSSSGIGLWEWDLDAAHAEWNKVLVDLYGVTEEEMKRNFIGFWNTCLHPDDREVVTRNMELFIKSDRPFLEEEYRIINRKTTEVLYLKCLTVAERDKLGVLNRLIGSAINVSKERKLQEKLRTNNAELKKANAELDNFVYSVSHDLRSPLLSVKGLLTLILQNPTIDEDSQSYLKMADKSINRLDDTISEILEYSRNARLETIKEYFSLQSLIEQIFDDLQFSVDDHFQFRSKIYGTDQILSDKFRLATVLRNLIGNAVKYRRLDIPRPFVNCEMFHEKDRLLCVVSDNGEGISEKDRSRVFDMFYRGNTNTVGTGLGLYICREVIHKMGGELHMESVEGSGTTFTFSIPL